MKKERNPWNELDAQPLSKMFDRIGLAEVIQMVNLWRLLECKHFFYDFFIGQIYHGRCVDNQVILSIEHKVRSFAGE
jgi:hypothetical protein